MSPLDVLLPHLRSKSRYRILCNTIQLDRKNMANNKFYVSLAPIIKLLIEQKQLTWNVKNQLFLNDIE